jgi:hypothetical protein
MRCGAKSVEAAVVSFWGAPEVSWLTRIAGPMSGWARVIEAPAITAPISTPRSD